MKRKMMNLAAMALSALLCFATTAAATQPETTWYVDASATGGDGKTPETAFKTLNDALTNSGLQEGNTIMIASGEYKGTDNTGIEISKNLNFIKYGDDEAIFDAENQRRIWTVKATSINITGLTFKNGKVDKGGAIYFANKLNNFNINATFTNNTASSSGGGAIHFEEDYEYTGNINGIFVNNTASSSGAAINVVRGSFAGNINGSFVNNKASYGGAVYIDQDFTGNIAGIFINNKGNSGGGAIELEHGTMSGNITGIFINNTADNGGAIYTDESDTDGLLIRDSIFINNKDNIAGSDYSEYNVFVKNSWFGNNANNYNTAPIVGDGVIMSDWLFLNATADPAELNVNGTSTITFKLDSYNDISKNVTSYDASKMNVVLELSQTLGELNKNTTLIGEEVIYTAKQEGNASVIGKVGNVEYTIPITVNKISPADLEAAAGVDELIDAIGEVEYTAESKGKIDAARAAYDALTPAQKDLVTKYETLTAAEATYADLAAAADASALIAAIGEVAYTAESKGKIDAARAAYDALTDAQKALVDADTLGVLTAAETNYADRKAAADAGALIAAIGEVAYTDASKAKIDAARAAYDALSDAQKALVGADTLGVLTAAETSYADLEAADAVIDAIDAIGEVAYTAECKALIDAARAAYDALTDAQKALVTNYETLTAAEATYAALAAAAEFDAYKTEQIAVVEALAQDGDSEDATALIAAAKADIEALAFDSSKTLEENKAAVDAIVAKLIADLARKAVIEVPVIEGVSNVTNVTVQVGQPYTDEVIAEITKAAQSTAKRHGQVVTGWVNADGSAVTGATIASTNDQLTAVWDTVNPLVPETDGEGTVLSDKAQKYDAYLLDADGAMVGTVHVSVGKRNKKTGLATVKATLKLVGSNKAYAFKAKEAKGGKATLSPDGMTKGVELANSKLGTMTIDIGTEGVCGAWNGYEINGVRDVSKAEKALYASWACVKTVAIADASGAYSTFSVKIGKSGSVNVRGYMSDGTSLSVSTRLMVADDGSEACVAVKGTKKAPVGFTLWLKHDDKGNVVAEGVESETGDALSGNAKTGDLGIGASSLTLKIGGVAVDVDYDGKSLKAAKDSGVTIRYTKSTGAFSGSRKVNTANAKGRAKKKTVSFKGVFVDGVGYGVTTTKGYAGVPVVIEAK